MHSKNIRSIKRCLSSCVAAVFALTSLGLPNYSYGQTVPLMPKPGTMVHLSTAFTPAHLKGLIIHPEDALKFDFIIHKGDESLNDAQKNAEYTKLMKYFLASLAVPDDNQWVNLSPYEKNRIIKDDFGQTEMGRDLLAQDYLLKQITASLIYPEEEVGRKFWDEVYKKAQQQFGNTNIPVNTFNKVWIIPDSASVHEKDNMVYVVDQHLKVMLEEDYLSLTKHEGINLTSNSTRNEVSSIGANMIRSVVLPILEREVNHGKNFANLRQVYSAIILAAWYKRSLKESLIGKIYTDQAKLKGIEQDPKNNEKIYQEYVKAFKKGVFNYIKEDMDRYSKQPISRKYFSGGAARLSSEDYALISTQAKAADMAQLGTGQFDAATVAIEELRTEIDDAAMITFFKNIFRIIMSPSRAFQTLLGLSFSNLDKNNPVFSTPNNSVTNSIKTVVISKKGQNPLFLIHNEKGSYNYYVFGGPEYLRPVSTDTMTFIEGVQLRASEEQLQVFYQGVPLTVSESQRDKATIVQTAKMAIRDMAEIVKSDSALLTNLKDVYEDWRTTVSRLYGKWFTIEDDEWARQQLVSGISEGRLAISDINQINIQKYNFSELPPYMKEYFLKMVSTAEKQLRSAPGALTWDSYYFVLIKDVKRIINELIAYSNQGYQLGANSLVGNKKIKDVGYTHLQSLFLKKIVNPKFNTVLTQTHMEVDVSFYDMDQKDQLLILSILNSVIPSIKPAEEWVRKHNSGKDLEPGESLTIQYKARGDISDLNAEFDRRFSEDRQYRTKFDYGSKWDDPIIVTVTRDAAMSSANMIKAERVTAILRTLDRLPDSGDFQIGNDMRETAQRHIAGIKKLLSEIDPKLADLVLEYLPPTENRRDYRPYGGISIRIGPIDQLYGDSRYRDENVIPLFHFHNESGGRLRRDIFPETDKSEYPEIARSMVRYSLGNLALNLVADILADMNPVNAALGFITLSLMGTLIWGNINADRFRNERLNNQLLNYPALRLTKEERLALESPGATREMRFQILMQDSRRQQMIEEIRRLGGPIHEAAMETLYYSYEVKARQGDANQNPEVGAQSDRAALSAPGGIDFNAANLNLQIKRDGRGIALPVAKQNLENIQIDGLIPVILEIKPAMDLPVITKMVKGLI